MVGTVDVQLFELFSDITPFFWTSDWTSTDQKRRVLLMMGNREGAECSASVFGGNPASPSMFSLVAKPPTFSKVFQFSRFCQLTSKMPSALLILAEGAEEMETVITADVLRRGGVSPVIFTIFKCSNTNKKLIYIVDLHVDLSVVWFHCFCPGFH